MKFLRHRFLILIVILAVRQTFLIIPVENYVAAVREQYERYPYPLREPEDERARLAHHLERPSRADQSLLLLPANRVFATASRCWWREAAPATT